MLGSLLPHDVGGAADPRPHAVPPGTQSHRPLRDPPARAADGIKLFFKEEALPAAANKWAFLAAPVVAVSTALLATAVIPYGPPFQLSGWFWGAHPLPGWLAGREVQILIADLEVGLLYIFAVTALGVYGVVLAGWAANNKYSLFGGLRSSAQMFSYELALGFSWVSLIMAAGFVPDQRHRGGPGRLVL